MFFYLSTSIKTELHGGCNIIYIANSDFKRNVLNLKLASVSMFGGRYYFLRNGLLQQGITKCTSFLPFEQVLNKRIVVNLHCMPNY